MRLESGQGTIAGRARDRPVDRGLDRHARTRRSGRVPGDRSRRARRSEESRPARRPPGVDGARRPVATMAGLCNATPLDGSRPRGELLAAEDGRKGEEMTDIRYRTID